MDERHRNLLLTVIDDYKDVAPFVYHIDSHKRSQEILYACVNSKWTGKKLYDIIVGDFDMRWLSFVKFVLESLDKRKQKIFREDLKW